MIVLYDLDDYWLKKHEALQNKPARAMMRRVASMMRTLSKLDN
jgi:hypothetical protein